MARAWRRRGGRGSWQGWGRCWGAGEQKLGRQPASLRWSAGRCKPLGRTSLSPETLWACQATAPSQEAVALPAPLAEPCLPAKTPASSSWQPCRAWLRKAAEAKRGWGLWQQQAAGRGRDGAGREARLALGVAGTKPLSCCAQWRTACSNGGIRLQEASMQGLAGGQSVLSDGRVRLIMA